MEDFKNFVQQYDEYLYKTEGRGASYGEIAYIDGLNKKELRALYNEMMENYYD